MYISYLKHNMSTELPRRLLTMSSLLLCNINKKQNKSRLEDSSKVDLAKKISDVLKELNLSPADLFIEVSLLQPNWLSAMVSSFMTKSKLDLKSLTHSMTKLNLTQEQTKLRF